jgi:hypothetical protein
LEDTSEASEGNLSYVGREAIKHFSKKETEYLQDKINEPESNSKNKKINKFKKGYQTRTNLMKDERGNLLADPHKF